MDKELIEGLSSSIKDILGGNYLLGNKIEVQNTVAIPLYKLKLNYTALDGEFKENSLANATTTSISATPVSLTVFKDGKLQVVSLEKESPIGELAMTVPNFFDGINQILKMKN